MFGVRYLGGESICIHFYGSHSQEAKKSCLDAQQPSTTILTARKNLETMLAVRTLGKHMCRRTTASTRFVAAMASRSLPLSMASFQPQRPQHFRSVVTFSFVEPDGEKVEIETEEGENLLDIAHDHDIEMEGACGGECACSTW